MPGSCTAVVVHSCGGPDMYKPHHVACSPLPVVPHKKVSQMHWQSRYCPVEVRQRAMDLLRQVAPKGSWLRGFMRRCARLAQPKDWPHLFMVWVQSVWESVMNLLSFCLGCIRRCVGHGRKQE